MGIRDTLTENPKAARIVVGAFVAIVAAVLGYQVWGMTGSSENQAPQFPQAFFTPDEGKTLLEANDTEIAPFNLKGQEVVAAHVFEVGGKRVVGYLSRYNKEGRDALLAMREQAKRGAPNPMYLKTANTTGREVKRPGEPKWVNAADPASATIINFKSPDGSEAHPVTP